MKMNPMAPANARHNLAEIRTNTYPGRIVVGGAAKQSPFDNPAYVLITAIGGRSEDSRNRQYVFDEDMLNIRTAFVKPSDADPSLIIYPAMDSNGATDFVASNGHQTSGILTAIRTGDGHQVELEVWEYEPDKPNYTPRISASLEILPNQPPRLILSRASKAPDGSYLEIPAADESNQIASDCIRESWNLPSMPGIGYMLTTYEGNGNPIPSYLGPPMTVPLEGTPEEMLSVIWEALNKDTRVGICLRIIDGVTGEYRTFIKNGGDDIVEV
jgi:IMP cyclohydrolase